jgi:ABC-2 type transport system permease protein
VIMRALPFRAMIDVPFRIYIGDITSVQIAVELLGQIGWVIALSLAGALSINRGMRRLVVQGG